MERGRMGYLKHECSLCVGHLINIRKVHGWRSLSNCNLLPPTKRKYKDNLHETTMMGEVPPFCYPHQTYFANKLLAGLSGLQQGKAFNRSKRKLDLHLVRFLGISKRKASSVVVSYFHFLFSLVSCLCYRYVPILFLRIFYCWVTVSLHVNKISTINAYLWVLPLMLPHYIK